MARILIFTGKGGVGKTSMAAAHAVCAARQGKKTLLVSTDMAHNLGDIFGIRVGSKPVQADENLWLQELAPDALLREEFPHAGKALGQLLGGAGLSAQNLDENTLLPGFENLFSLLKIGALWQSGGYDHILVDCAPTGETLALLKLPELLSWYMEKFFPVGRLMVRALSPVAKNKYKITLPDRQAMDELEQLHAKLVELQALLQDPAVCSVRLVCLPEKMAVEETKRSFMYLHLYGYAVDGLYINRILPPEADNDFLRRWQTIQAGYIAELAQVFAGVPITRVPWYPDEVRGRAAIDRLCAQVLTDPDLLTLRAAPAAERYEAIPGGYCLVLPMPGAAPEALTVRRRALDLEIKLNNFIRCIPLPDTLRGAQLGEVRLADGTLRVDFVLPASAEKEGDAVCGS